MTLKIRRLCEFFVATVKRTHIRPVPCMYSDVRSAKTKTNRNKHFLRRAVYTKNKRELEKRYLKLKSRLNLLPQPSKVHWNGFSPVCTSWCLFSLLDSTKALPHSAQTCTRGPCVCRCFLIAELSRNILLQPLWGHATKQNSNNRRVVSFVFFFSKFKSKQTYSSVGSVMIGRSPHTRTLHSRPGKFSQLFRVR